MEVLPDGSVLQPSGQSDQLTNQSHNLFAARQECQPLCRYAARCSILKDANLNRLLIYYSEVTILKHIFRFSIVMSQCQIYPVAGSKPARGDSMYQRCEPKVKTHSSMNRWSRRAGPG